MNIFDIETILKDNFISCDAEECWNGCSTLDEYGYIDVAIVFERTPEIENLFEDLISTETNTCWIWACSTSKGTRSEKYYLTGMESAPKISRKTNLAKAIIHLFDTKIKKAKKDLYEQLRKEEE